MKNCKTCEVRATCVELCKENLDYVDAGTNGQKELLPDMTNFTDRFCFSDISEIEVTTVFFVARLYWSGRKTPVEIETETGFSLPQIIAFISIIQNSIEYFLDKVTVSQRVKLIVRLHFFERKTAREISDALGVSVYNVYEYLSRFVNSVGRLEKDKCVISALLNDVKNSY